MQSDICPPITTLCLKVQTDIHSCGFWVVIYALALLLECRRSRVLALSVLQIKELLGSLYASFIGDAAGIPAPVLSDLVAPLEPTIDIMRHGSDVVCCQVI